MTRARWIVITSLILVGSISACLWWVYPRPVDMSSYAPADSLIYLESNSPAEVAAALSNTDAGRLAGSLVGKQIHPDQRSWLQGFVRWTGIGPINSVVLSRSQIAVVVTDLGLSEAGETLTVKPEGALLIETHTSEARLKEPVQKALKQFAESAYGQPSLRRATIDNSEFTEWIAPGGSRQVVSTIVGTLVIVGNTEHAVQQVLAVVLRGHPSLKADSELQRMRNDLQTPTSLAFGYIPAAKSARLLSITLPLLLGRVPDNAELEKLISSNAARIVSNVGWNSQSIAGGIEDRYQLNLQPQAAAKLNAIMACSGTNQSFAAPLPDNFSSLTYYQFQSPATSWQNLKTAVSSEVDALSAIFFSSLLKSALLPYGVTDADRFLSLVERPVLTARFDDDSSLLVAKVHDQASLQEQLNSMGFHQSEGDPSVASFVNREADASAVITKGLIAMGTTRVVDNYKAKLVSDSTHEGNDRALAPPLSSNPCVYTYADDKDRARSFVSAVLRVNQANPTVADQAASSFSTLPFSTTETVMAGGGIERITRSPVGQLGALLPLIFPEKPAPAPSP